MAERGVCNLCGGVDCHAEDCPEAPEGYELRHFADLDPQPSPSASAPDGELANLVKRVRDGTTYKDDYAIRNEAADAIEKLVAELSTRPSPAAGEWQTVRDALNDCINDLEGTYSHVSSVTADRIKNVTLPKARAALLASSRYPSPFSGRALLDEKYDPGEWDRRNALQADCDAPVAYAPGAGREWPSEADIRDTAKRLRDWAGVLEIPSGPFVNEDLRLAADLIDRLAAAPPAGTAPGMRETLLTKADYHDHQAAEWEEAREDGHRRMTYHRAAGKKYRDAAELVASAESIANVLSDEARAALAATGDGK